MAEEEAPNPEQADALNAVFRRCEVEAAEEARDERNASAEEPSVQSCRGFQERARVGSFTG